MTFRLPDGSRKSSTERGYNHRWRKARATYLASHPFCVMCAKDGKRVKADVVDHIEPHRGDQAKFWSVENWAAMCAPCHNSRKQMLERSGKVKPTIGIDGWPPS